MKTIFLLIVISVFFTPAYGEENEMTEKQKLSYALGVFFAQSVTQQDIDMDTGEGWNSREVFDLLVYIYFLFIYRLAT